MDPQLWLLPGTVYETMEEAELTFEGLKGSDTAGHFGVMATDYEGVLSRDVDGLPTYSVLGISRAITSNRVSCFFNWHGPSMTIDTACSSSMIAVHQGIKLLISECFIFLSKINLLSPSGCCHTWDEKASGYARSDSRACVVREKLSNAISNLDRIECIVWDTGINQDGKSSGSVTVLSTDVQASLICRAYAQAGPDITDPGTWLQILEAYATGTKIGYPREAADFEIFVGQKVRFIQ